MVWPLHSNCWAFWWPYSIQWLSLSTFTLRSFPTFLPCSIQADTEKARSSSSSRSSSRHRRVCISPTHFLFVCLYFLSSFSFNPAVNLSSPMFLFDCLYAMTLCFHITRGWMMMSCQSAATGCVHNTSLPVLLRLCSHEGMLCVKAFVLVGRAFVKWIYMGEKILFDHVHLGCLFFFFCLFKVNLFSSTWLGESIQFP